MTAAARQRLHREREREGRILLTLELDEAETIELLIEAQLLDPRQDYFTAPVLAEAIGKFLQLARHA